MLRRKILADTARLNVSGLFAQGMSVLQSLLLLKFLEPQEFGYWLAALLVLSYASYASVGIEHGMALRLPFYRGRQDEDSIRVSSDTAFLTWSLASLLCAVGIAIVAVLGEHDPRTRYALVTVAALVPLTQQQAFHSRWQTSVPIDFTLATRILVIQSFLLFGLVVPLTYVYGLVGVLAGNVIGNALIAVLWLRSSGFRYGARFSARLLRELLKAGVPMLLVVIGGGLIQTVDRLVILSRLGAASLGYYGITSLGGNALYSLFSQAGSAMSPHIVEASGRSEGDHSQLAKYLVKPTLLFAYASSALLLLAAAVVPVIVRGFVPKYVQGIPAFFAYIPGFFFLAVILTAGNIVMLVMIDLGKARVPVYLQFVAIAIEAGCAFAALQAGFGLVGVALSSTLAYAVYGLSMMRLAGRHVLSPAERRALFREMLVPFVLAVGLGATLFVMTSATLAGQPIARGIADVLGSVVIAGLMAVIGVRRMDLGHERQAIKGKLRMFFANAPSEPDANPVTRSEPDIR